MNCLQNLPRSSGLSLRNFTGTTKTPYFPVVSLGMTKFADQRLSIVAQVVSGSESSTEKDETEKDAVKSDTYSNDMTAAMGAGLSDMNKKAIKLISLTYQGKLISLPAPGNFIKLHYMLAESAKLFLTYRHELGMNYNFIRPDLIVGSCLQTPEDVDKLRSIGVKTIFCLQQNPDLEYFGVDIGAIREYANKCSDIEHLRAEIRDFDAFDLRLRLPAVVSKLSKAVNRNGGVTYIHCTAGLGRAPAVALTYMFWVQGYKLSEAFNLLMSKRSCFPKLDAIKSATADILTGLKRKPATLTWSGDDCSTVEISGLDIGWGQRIPLEFDEERGLWTLQRDLPEGHYEYKYIVDGVWTCNEFEPITSPNKDGHVNNYVKVLDDNPDSISAAVRNRLTSDDPDLTSDERLIIREFLEAYPDEE